MIDADTPRPDGDKEIVVLGAKEHNLQNVNLRIPRDKLVVITGLSGSGKSSLAFDTIYAEGQRKYVESLSAYARQFLEQLQKPDVEHIEGLPPTIAIEQRAGGSNPRSTVATTTEIYDYLRLLFARVGKPHCWVCGRPISSQTVTQIVDADHGPAGGHAVHGPGPAGPRTEGAARGGPPARSSARASSACGSTGQIYDVKAVPETGQDRKHTIEVVVDRLVLKESVRPRLADSLETAVRLGEGLVIVCHEERPAAQAPSAGEPRPRWRRGRT